MLMYQIDAEKGLSLVHQTTKHLSEQERLDQTVSRPKAVDVQSLCFAAFATSVCLAFVVTFCDSKLDHYKELSNSAQSRILATHVNCKQYPKPLPFAGKKGIGRTLRTEGESGSWLQNLPLILSLKPSWCYSWGLELIDFVPESMEFVPMLWGTNKNLLETAENLLDKVVPYIHTGQVKRFFGLNEPDNIDQSNSGVSKALEVWPLLESLNVPLASPSCVHADEDWMVSFMRAAESSCKRIDWVGVHWYKQPDIKLFKQDMLSYHKLYNRSLVITEFSPADWSATTPASNRNSPADVLAFAKEALPWLESQDFIAAYAWFSFPVNSSVGASSALFDANGGLTAVGRYYASVQTDNPNGSQWITPDPDLIDNP